METKKTHDLMCDGHTIPEPSMTSVLVKRCVFATVRRSKSSRSLDKLSTLTKSINGHKYLPPHLERFLLHLSHVPLRPLSGGSTSKREVVKRKCRFFSRSHSAQATRANTVRSSSDLWHALGALARTGPPGGGSWIPPHRWEGLGMRRNGAALSPEMGVFAPPSPFFKNV